MAEVTAWTPFSPSPLRGGSTTATSQYSSSDSISLEKDPVLMLFSTPAAARLRRAYLTARGDDSTPMTLAASRPTVAPKSPTPQYPSRRVSLSLTSRIDRTRDTSTSAPAVLFWKEFLCWNLEPNPVDNLRQVWFTSDGSKCVVGEMHHGKPPRLDVLWYVAFDKCHHCVGTCPSSQYETSYSGEIPEIVENLPDRGSE